MKRKQSDPHQLPLPFTPAIVVLTPGRCAARTGINTRRRARSEDCDICGGPGWYASNPNGKPFFGHEHGNCKDNVAGKFSAYRQHFDYRSFTEPSNCKDCGGKCFHYKEFSFAELGPPWTRHECGCERKRPYQWERDGYIPCDISDGELLGDSRDSYRLILWVDDLKSEIKRQLYLCIDRQELIKFFIKQLQQPFHLKPQDSCFWDLNTFERSYGYSVPYRCSEAKFPHPMPPWFR
jgi:hypothetical protein